MQTVLVRLINNDHVIGQMVENSYDVVSLYAPMIICPQEDDHIESKSYFVYMPYDPLSDTCMVVFDNTHVLTVTHPKKVVDEYYHAAWPKYYPEFKDYKKKMMKQMFEEDQANIDSDFTDEKLKDMFTSFMEGIDKKKLN